MSDLWSALRRRRTAVRRSQSARSARFQLEQLEDRIVPAAYLDGGATAYATIQAAVNAAHSGDVITVDPGAYNEKVTVNVSVTIEGAQQGIAGQSSSRVNNPSDESILTGANGSTSFYVTANDVTIDGFTVEGATSPNNFGFGILIAGGVSGTHIQNNIIQDNIVGIGLANGSGDQAVIQDNLIRDNNRSGPASGTGIYSDQYVAGGTLQNVLISNNVISGNQNAGIGLSSTDPTKPGSNITISGNTFDSNGRQIYLYSTVSSTIDGNTIRNATTPTDGGSSVAIGLYGNDDHLSITGNLLSNGDKYGIRIGNFNTAANTNVTLNDNSISGFPTGLHLDSAGYSGKLAASGNFWGSSTGPTDPLNAGGWGEKIDDPDQVVDYAPWLSSGANSTSSAQPGFGGNAGSLISNNPTPFMPSDSSGPSSGPDLLTALRQQIVLDLMLAQGLQGANLAQGEQLLGGLFALASMQSPQNATALVFDEAALTAGGALALSEAATGAHNSALLGKLGQLEADINDNPLTPTPTGQQLIKLTGGLVVAEILAATA